MTDRQTGAKACGESGRARCYTLQVLPPASAATANDASVTSASLTRRDNMAAPPSVQLGLTLWPCKETEAEVVVNLLGRRRSPYPSQAHKSVPPVWRDALGDSELDSTAKLVGYLARVGWSSSARFVRSVASTRIQETTAVTEHATGTNSFAARA